MEEWIAQWESSGFFNEQSRVQFPACTQSAAYFRNFFFYSFLSESNGIILIIPWGITGSNPG